MQGRERERERGNNDGAALTCLVEVQSYQGHLDTRNLLQRMVAQERLHHSLEWDDAFQPRRVYYLECEKTCWLSVCARDEVDERSILKDEVKDSEYRGT